MNHEDLKELYTRAKYSIPDESIEMTVGVKSVDLEAFLKAKNAKKGALITAANPYSQKLSDWENTTRNTLLEEACKDRWTYLPALATANDGDSWDEASLFLLDISLKEALALAGSFGQHAILYYELGGEI